jgi:predicted nucleic acid-binding protein
LAIDEAVMRRAHDVEQQYRLSWWDSLVIAAAQLQGCVVLLTEDLQDGGVYGGVTVRSPFTSALREAASVETAAPAAAAPRRRRGKAKRPA